MAGAAARRAARGRRGHPVRVWPGRTWRCRSCRCSPRRRRSRPSTSAPRGASWPSPRSGRRRCWGLGAVLVGAALARGSGVDGCGRRCERAAEGHAGQHPPAGAHLPLRGPRGGGAVRRRPRRRARRDGRAARPVRVPASPRCSACWRASSGPAPARCTSATSSCRRPPARELDEMRASEVSLMLQGAARNLLPYLTPHENVRFAQARRPARPAGTSRTPGTCSPGSGWPSEAAPAARRRSPPGHLQLARSRSRSRPGPGCCSPTSRPASSTTRPGTGCWAACRGQPRARHHGRARHPRPRRRGQPAADDHHPRRPGRRRGPHRRGVRRGHRRRLPAAAGARPRRPRRPGRWSASTWSTAATSWSRARPRRTTHGPACGPRASPSGTASWSRCAGSSWTWARAAWSR